ncbi:hypothetical protein ABPG72_014060 [Tetrahymena utriculariae]
MFTQQSTRNITSYIKLWQIEIFSNNPSCRFCVNSGQQIGQNKCNISLDQYQKDTKCISFYQGGDNQNYCDLCLEGYTPTPLGCLPCKKESHFCSQISLQIGKNNLFSLISLQLFKRMFTQQLYGSFLNKIYFS